MILLLDSRLNAWHRVHILLFLHLEDRPLVFLCWLLLLLIGFFGLGFLLTRNGSSGPAWSRRDTFHLLLEARVAHAGGVTVGDVQLVGDLLPVNLKRWMSTMSLVLSKKNSLPISNPAVS